MNTGRLQDEETRIRKVLIALHGSDCSQKDLKIITKEGQWHLCHAALLATTSVFINSLLKDSTKDENGHIVLFLPDINANVIKEFLRIIYCSQKCTPVWVEMHKDLADGLDILADMFNLDGSQITHEQLSTSMGESLPIQVKTEIIDGQEATLCQSISRKRISDIAEDSQTDKVRISSNESVPDDPIEWAKKVGRWEFSENHVVQEHQVAPFPSTPPPPMHEVLRNLKYLKPLALKTTNNGDQDPLLESHGEGIECTPELPLEIDPNSIPCPVSLHRCPDCPRTFTQRNNLLQHVRKMHNKKASDIGAETKSWSKVRGSDALQQAIKAVKEGGMSHSVAARMFGISRCGPYLNILICPFTGIIF